MQVFMIDIYVCICVYMTVNMDVYMCVCCDVYADEKDNWLIKIIITNYS